MGQLEAMGMGRPLLLQGQDRVLWGGISAIYLASGIAESPSHLSN